MMSSSSHRPPLLLTALRILTTLTLGTSLLLSAVFFSKTLYLPFPNQLTTTSNYTVGHARLTTISCALSRNGTLATTQRIIYYLLTAFTLAARHKDYVSTTSAGYVMAYSGVAAVYQIVIYRYAPIMPVRWQDPAKSEVQRVVFPLLDGLGGEGRYEEVLLSAGVDDADRDAVCVVVGVGLLAGGALYLWSRIFDGAEDSRQTDTQTGTEKRDNRRRKEPVLLSWLLLLAISHVFCALSATDLGRHYYIRPINVTDVTLPGSNYVAPQFEDEAFMRDFRDIVERGVEKHIYSCFEYPNYPPQRGRQVGVYDFNAPGNSTTPGDGFRKLGIAFWTVALAVGVLALTLKREEPKGGVGRSEKRSWWDKIWQYPHIRKTISFISPVETAGGFVWEVVRSIFGMEDTGSQRTWLKTAARTLEYFLRIMSGVLLIVWTIFQEAVHRGVPESESFVAVGQWCAVAVVFFLAYAKAMDMMMLRSGGADEVSDSDLVIPASANVASEGENGTVDAQENTTGSIELVSVRSQHHHGDSVIQNEV